MCQTRREGTPPPSPLPPPYIVALSRTQRALLQINLAVECDEKQAQLDWGHVFVGWKEKGIYMARRGVYRNFPEIMLFLRFFHLGAEAWKLRAPLSSPQYTERTAITALLSSQTGERGKGGKEDGQ